MEETLVTTALDLGGRAFFVFQAEFPSAKIGDFDSELVADFWQAFAANALANLHVVLHHGRNSHHIAEAIFKSAARAPADVRRPRLPHQRRAQHQGHANVGLEQATDLGVRRLVAAFPEYLPPGGTRQTT